MDLFKAGAIVGAVGDVGLQTASRLGIGNEGLERYFEENHPLESVALASGLTAMWSGLYGLVAGDQKSLHGFMAWSAAVDILYRYEHPVLYPSLADYYAHNTPLASVLYNIITAGLVWGVNKGSLLNS